jgi:hypothetical protein
MEIWGAMSLFLRLDQRKRRPLQNDPAERVQCHEPRQSGKSECTCEGGRRYGPYHKHGQFGVLQFALKGCFNMSRAFARSALALLVLTSPAFQPRATAQTVDQVIVHALQNQRDEGFNFYSITRSGWAVHQLVLWFYVPTPPPDQVNLNSLGVPDSDPASRHDRLTHLVYLANLALYIQAFLDERQFDADIATYTNIVQGEFRVLQGLGIDDRGWVYFLFKEMAAPLPAFDGYADAMTDNYDRRVSANIRTFGVAVPIHISTSGDRNDRIAATKRSKKLARQLVSRCTIRLELLLNLSVVSSGLVQRLIAPNHWTTASSHRTEVAGAVREFFT